jgi:hypothetical protein
LLSTLVAELLIVSFRVAVHAFPGLTAAHPLPEVLNADDAQRHQEPQKDRWQNVRSNEFHAETPEVPRTKRFVAPAA